MIFPPYLQPGDRVRIVAPAGKVTKEKVMPGIVLLQEAGYEVLIGNHVFDKHFQYAGTDAQRLNDFQEALNDPLTRAIICARGGYGSVRLVDKLDFSTLLTHPKWIVGFSDITLIHTMLNKLRLASVHGAMPAFYLENKKPAKSFYSLLDALSHGRSQVELEPNDFNRLGNGSGELVGGNLSLIYSLQGTPWQLDTRGKILFLEDVSEYLYHLDRMMHNLRLSGQLQQLAGLVLGGFTDMKDNESPFGKSTCEIISEAVKDYDYPVCFDFPAGHIPRNLSLIMGAPYFLEVGSKCILKK
ncbi:MAG: S66 peptidase family protein [Methylococcaceae bacterium]